MTAIVSTICALVALLTATSVSASVVYECLTDRGDHHAYVGSTQYVRGISVYFTVSEIYLTHCEREKMVEISDLGPVEYDGYAKDLVDVHQTLVFRYVAKRESWSFAEVASYMNTRGYRASIEPIVRDGCICEAE